MTRSRTAQILGWAALAVLVLAAASCLVLEPKQHLLVVMGFVIRPGWTGTILLGVAAVLGLFYLVLKFGDSNRPRRKPRVLQALAFAAVAAVAVVSFLWSSLSDLASTHYVLEPASPSGCRVVVDEASFLDVDGQIHLLPANAVFTHPASRYFTTSSPPIRSGNYQLTWDGERGLLRLQGEGPTRVEPQLHQLSCG